MTRSQFRRAMTGTGDANDQRSAEQSRRFYLKGNAQFFFSGRADRNDVLLDDMLVRVQQDSGMPVVIDIYDIAAIELEP